MAGILDALSGLGQGAEAAFAHPAVQAALAGYLGALGSPRYQGLGSALSRGGLTGLAQYNTALRSSNLMPLQQSEIAKNVATTKEIGQLGQLHAAQAARLGPDPNGAQTLQMMSQDANQPPLSRHIYQSLSGEVGAGRISIADALKVGASQDLNQARMLQAQAAAQASTARTALSTEQLKELPGLTASKEAEEGAVGSAALSRAGTAAAIAPSEIQRNVAEAARAKAGPELPGRIEYGPGGATRVTRSAEPDPGFAFQAPPKPQAPAVAAAAGIRNLTGVEKLRQSERGLGTKVEEFFSGSTAKGNREAYAISRGIDPNTGQPLAPPPTNGINPKTGKPITKLDPGWRLVGTLSDGRPVALDPTGVPHVDNGE
jgi:hypothetical protein